MEFRPFSTHLNIRVFWAKLVKQWNRWRLSSSTCTVANRSRSWTKNLCLLVSLHCPGRGSRIWGFGPLKVCIVSELNSPCAALCIEAPTNTVNIRSSVSLAPSQGNKTQFNVRHELAYLLAKFHATLLIQSACREVSSGGCSSKPGAQGFRSWSSPFWIMPPDCPFLSRIQLCTRCILRIACVSRRSVQSQYFNFPWNRIYWIWVLRYTTSDLFSHEYLLLFDLALRFLLTVSLST